MSKAAAPCQNSPEEAFGLTGPAPRWLDQAPLVDDLRLLGDPAVPLSTQALMNVAAKYFFAFVHPGAQANPVPPSEVGALLGLFARCHSLNEPGDDIEIMNFLRRFAPALSLAGDPETAARMLQALLGQRVPETGRFLGLDLYTGSGLLVLGQYLLARRAGIGAVEVWGLEEDGEIAERAGALLRNLGAGNAAYASPSRVASYELVGGRNLALVTAAGTAGTCADLCDERFFGAYAALFEACGPALDRAEFFPEGLIVYSRETNASLILSHETGFQRPAEFEGAVLHPQAWIVNGEVLPLHRLSRGQRSAGD
ncbi:MAG: hypothetical protein AB7E32_16660 [Desulfovibrio sp.]